MFRSIIQSVMLVGALMLAGVMALVLPGCTAPGATTVATITDLCAADAQVRPTVTALVAAGFATPAQSKAIDALHLTIDTVCNNPASSPAENAQTVLTDANAQITAILTQLLIQKAAAAAAAAKAASA